MLEGEVVSGGVISGGVEELRTGEFCVEVLKVRELEVGWNDK